MILSGNSIRNNNIIQPFSTRTKAFGMTYGVGPAGYDVRVEFDPEGSIQNVEMYNGDFVLASTIEHFTMPSDVLGIVHDKSSWARKGLAVQNTVIEPGWKGYLTLELTHHGPHPITIRRGSPIAQIVFHYLDEVTNGYDGKYQNQVRGPVSAIEEFH